MFRMVFSREADGLPLLLLTWVNLQWQKVGDSLQTNWKWYLIVLDKRTSQSQWLNVIVTEISLKWSIYTWKNNTVNCLYLANYLPQLHHNKRGLIVQIRIAYHWISACENWITFCYNFVRVTKYMQRWACNFIEIVIFMQSWFGFETSTKKSKSEFKRRI